MIVGALLRLLTRVVGGLFALGIAFWWCYTYLHWSPLVVLLIVVVGALVLFTVRLSAGPLSWFFAGMLFGAGQQAAARRARREDIYLGYERPSRTRRGRRGESAWEPEEYEDWEPEPPRRRPTARKLS